MQFGNLLFNELTGNLSPHCADYAALHQAQRSCRMPFGAKIKNLVAGREAGLFFYSAQCNSAVGWGSDVEAPMDVSLLKLKSMFRHACQRAPKSPRLWASKIPDSGGLAAFGDQPLS